MNNLCILEMLYFQDPSTAPAVSHCHVMLGHLTTQ